MGLWGEPDIVDGFETQPVVSDFANDAQKLYLYEWLEALALEFPAQAHSVVLTLPLGSRLHPTFFHSSDDWVSIALSASSCKKLS